MPPRLRAMHSAHTYGEWQQLQNHLLWCYDHLKAATATPTKWQPITGHNSAWLVRSGWAEVRCEGVLLRARRGEWLLAPPRARLQRFSTRVHLLSVAFQAQWLDGRPWYDQGLPVVLPARACPQLEKAGSRLARSLKKLAPAVDGSIQQTRFESRGFLRLLRAMPAWLEAYIKTMGACGIAASRPQALDERVTTAQRHLRTWPLNEPLNPGQLARACGLGRRQLERLFLNQFDTTPHRYLEQLRLQAACNALRQRTTQVKSIALQLGFGNSSHVSHWFHRWTGSSPRAFRHNLLF